MNKKFVQFIANKYFLILIFIFLVLSGAIFAWQIFTNNSQMSLQVSVPDNYQDKIVYSYQGQSFAIQPIAASSVNVKKKFFAEEYDYQDPYSKVDVKRLVSETGVKEDIVLREPGHPMQFKFQLDLGEFDYVKDLTGNITLTSKTDKLEEKDLQRKFFLPAPFFIDAAGKQSDTSAIDLRIDDKGIITYTLNESWLAQAQYPVVLDPSVELVILNVHSYPQTGDEWVVDFTTQGTADLIISPADQATIDDDRFVGLYCDGEERLPEIYKNDVIFYANWSCAGVGRVVHFTEYAGKHTLKFEFAGQVAYAYNSDWWNPSWTKRKKIFFDTTTSATTSNLIDFPLSVQLNSTRVDYTATQNSGQDIRFVDTDGTELPYEIESWNESGTSTLWVKVPQVNQNTTADYMWMYYGNSTAADNSTTTGVWDNNYKLVQHMDNTVTSTDSFVDSTKNYNHGTGFGGGSLAATSSGKINGAFNFDGTDDYVEVSNDSSLSGMNELSMSAWIYLDQLPTTVAHDVEILVKRHSTTPWNSYYFYIVGTACTNDNVMYVSLKNELEAAEYRCASSSLAVGQWYHVAVTWDGSDLHFYLNGSYDDEGATNFSGTSVFSSDGSFYINGEDSGPGRMDGKIDEVRISSIDRGVNWIKFEYCNQTDSCTTYGTEETDVWWNTKWLKRKKIMFDTTTSATTTSLVDFPVAVQLNSSRIDYAYTKPYGEDIRFIDSDGKTSLSYEIEKWDKTATSTFWVKVPTIDRNSNSDHIWLYYNNPNALDNSTTTGVWTNGFVGVWHMNNAYNASTTDSTKNALHGISRNLAATSTYMVGSALQFNGSTADVKLPISTLLNPEYTLTIEAWARTNSLSGEQSILGRTLSYELLAMRTWAPTGRPLAPIYYAYDTSMDLESATALTPGQFTYLAATYNGTTTGKAILYQDTIIKHTITTTTPESLYQNSANTYIGDSQWDDNSGFSGVIDEVRISDTDRTKSWINFTYCNIKETCNTYGKEQTYGWWDTRWQKRKPIYFDTTTSATTSDLANFTALVRLNSSRINYTYTQNSGQDIRFVDADGLTELPYEIENWNESGESIVWVKVPKIDKNSKTDHIWMYYDNPLASDNSTTTGTWNSNYVIVQHLQETTTGASDFKDSTSYGNDSVAVTFGGTGSNPDAVGKINGAIQFDGTDDTISFGDSDDFSATNGVTDRPISVSFWVKPDTFGAGGQDRIMQKYDSSGEWEIWNSDTGAVNFAFFDQTTYDNGIGRAVDFALTEGQWDYLTMTYNGNETNSGIKIFRNGVRIDDADYANGTYPGSSNTDSQFRMGWNYGSDYWDGFLDEVRIANIELDPNWITFEYCNMNDACASFGAEEAQAIKIYRSMGFNNTSPLASGSSTVELTISGFDATFSAGMPMRVGVGDAIQYDSDSNGSVDSIVFIHKRVSSTQYEIRTANGTSTPTAVTADKDWRIYRAYTTSDNAVSGVENTGIASALRNFDTWSLGDDLVTKNYQWNIALYADAVEVVTTTSLIDTSNWTTGPKNYLRFFTPVNKNEVGVSQRHNGRLTDTAYKILINVAGDYQDVYQQQANYIRIEGIQCEISSPTAYIGIHCINLNRSTGAAYISENIFKGESGVIPYQGGIKFYHSAPAGITAYIWNNIFYDFRYPSGTEAYGISINQADSIGYVYNNTFYNCNEAIHGRLLLIQITNNIMQNTNTCYSTWNGSNAYTDYNMCDNSNGSPGSHSLNNVTVSFVSSTASDFRLKSSDSVARDKGKDMSGDVNLPFNNDIENQTRQGPWDIGADEYVVTSLGTQGWWQSAWKNRMKITIDNSSQSETLTNFPLVVTLYSSRIDYTQTQNSGQDIRFVASDGTELPYEIEKWDEAATSTVWVKVPQINGGSNAGYIWMYYGNPDAADNQSPNDVWDTNYKFVHHLEESPDDTVAGHFDSTSNNATGTPYNFQTGGTGTTNATGKLDGADYFSVTTNNDYVTIPSLASQQLTASGTLEAWVKPDLTTGRIVTHGQQNGFWLGYVSSKFNVNLFNGALNAATTSYVISGTDWYYVVGTFGYDGATKYLRLYVNGLLQDSVALSTNNINYESADYRSCINAYGDCSGGFGQHTIDEVRLSNVTRSADWIKFSYCNMNDSCLDYTQSEAFGDSTASSGGSSKVKGGIQIKGGIRFK